MARARLIKPGFFTNDRLAEVSPLGRLLFAGLWTIADREGRLEDRPKRIRAELLPYDAVDADELLTELSEAGFIQRYVVGEWRIIQVVAFTKHQSPHPKEPPSQLPVMGMSVTSHLQVSGKKGTSPAVAVAVADPDPVAVAVAEAADTSEPAAAAAPVRRVMDAWTNATGFTVTQQVADSMLEAIDDLGEEWTLEAIREAGEANARSWRYVKAVLERWKRDGREVERAAAPPCDVLSVSELEAAGLRKRYKPLTLVKEAAQP